jgi:PAS domain S-box-containing protein
MPDLSQIFESINEGLVVLDRNLRVLHWNPWMARNSGIAEKDITGMVIFDHFPSLDTPKFHRNRRAVMAFGNYAYFSQGLHHYLFPFKTKGTSAAWFPTMQQSCSMGPIREDGNICGLYILVQDVTDRLVLDRLKTEFVSMVTHELRTPLTSIRGSLSLVVSGALGEISPQAKNLLSIASRNGERLSNLINDLLDSEKLEAGKMKFHIESHSLHALLELALSDNQGYGELHGVVFHLNEVSPDIQVEVDRSRFFQIMSNLLSNASKYSPEGGRVDVSVNEEGHLVRIFIADQGAGIPNEFLGRVFQKFAQADSGDAPKKGGTGLGLSITKTLLEQMGGTIGFRTQLGAGTTFEFTLKRTVPIVPDSD